MTDMIAKWAGTRDTMRGEWTKVPLDQRFMECYDALVLAQERIEKLKRALYGVMSISAKTSVSHDMEMRNDARAALEDE